jgi:hypothetical protein
MFLPLTQWRISLLILLNSTAVISAGSLCDLRASMLFFGSFSVTIVLKPFSRPTRKSKVDGETKIEYVNAERKTVTSD